MKFMTFKNVVLLPGFVVGSICLCWMIWAGFGWWILGCWSLISGLGIAVGFHRIYSHKTHTLAPWLDNTILILGSMAGQGSSITWTAVHRGYHHRHTDTDKDLHSPIHGVWHSFLGWYSQINENTINHKYAVDLLRRSNHVFIHKNYLHLHLLWIVLLLWISLSFWVPVFPVYMSCLFLSLLQDNLVNTLCHIRRLGYKNGKGKDNSVNIPILGYLTWGQAHHENHHVDPSRFSFRKRWWEFDPAVLWLPLIRLGTIYERRIPESL
jgi:fatty-acid desaturase